MVTLQEQFEKDFPDKSVGKINCMSKYKNFDFTNWDLDLREYKDLIFFNFPYNNLTSLNASGLSNLIFFNFYNNKITSVDFLNDLPNPEKLEELLIYNNNIQPTDISIFSKFINLKSLKIGNSDSKRKKYNRFYGSLKSYQNLTKLRKICIEATDVNEGLEYLPESLVKRTKEERYNSIECSPHNTNAKCKAIQDQLRPFNYDIEAWQLAHPKKMLISRPEYFTNPDSKDKWLTALNSKILEVRQEIINARENEADKLSKIARLETKIQELETAKQTISQQTQTEFSTQNKGTQTDLTMEQIKQWEQGDNKKTLYQNFIDKYGKK